MILVAYRLFALATPHNVKLSEMNKFTIRGLAIYDNFEHVIVLTTCHRLETIENPTTLEEVAFNERADLFLDILHRLRYLRWTFADYSWLCKRQK